MNIVKYLGQRSLSSKVTIHTFSQQINCSKVVGNEQRSQSHSKAHVP